MVPLSKCSSTNFFSSCCSAADSLIVWLISVDGAPGLSLILWSHGRNRGSFFDSSSLKTSANALYWYGIRSSTWIVLMIAFLPLVLVEKIARFASSLLRTMGSCAYSIHPFAQSIRGWALANHGYPRMIWFSPRSVR